MTIGALVAATEPAERRRLVDELVGVLTPVEDHEDEWAALLAEPGFVRYTALALFVEASGSLAGNWRSSSPTLQADFDRLGDLLVLGHEAEDPYRRLPAVLVDGGAAAVRDDLLGVLDAVVTRARRHLASGVWEGDPDVPDDPDRGRPLSADDRTLLEEGVGHLEAWRASSLR